MSDLTEWLLACIAEDEAVARHKGADAMTGHRWKHAPENVYQEIQSEVLDNCRHALAVCKAHREVVEAYVDAVSADDNETDTEEHWVTSRVEAELREVVLRLATIYADRPGWREEWAS